MPADEEESIQAIVNIKEAGSVSRAIANVRGNSYNNLDATLDISPTDKFYKALKKTGINEKMLASSLLELLSAKKLTVDRLGKINETPDNPVRLKTIELLLRFFAPDNSPAQNHLHLHGKKLDELLNKDTSS